MSAMRMTYITGKLLTVALAFAVLWMAKCEPWDWLKDLKPLGINPDKFCIFDKVHYDLQDQNILIRHKTGLAYTLQLLSSMMVDAAFLNSCVTWISTCKTGRLYWAILFFYLTRAIIQVLLSNLGNVPISFSPGLSLGRPIYSLNHGALWTDFRLLL